MQTKLCCTEKHHLQTTSSATNMVMVWDSNIFQIFHADLKTSAALEVTVAATAGWWTSTLVWRQFCDVDDSKLGLCPYM